MLFYDSPLATQKQIRVTDKRIRTLIEKTNEPVIPSTIDEAKRIFREQLQTYYALLQVFKSSDQVEVILVPDTNALIMSPDVASYGSAIGQAEYTIVILPTVLSELDKLKITHRSDDFRTKVQSVINRLKGLRKQGNMHDGVTVNKVVTVKMIAHEPDFKKTLSWLDPTNNDDRIIAATLEVQREEPSSIVVLVTNDINHQNKAEMASLPFIEPPATPIPSP
jgi:rRNA-processing protein FCF1